MNNKDLNANFDKLNELDKQARKLKGSIEKHERALDILNNPNFSYCLNIGTHDYSVQIDSQIEYRELFNKTLKILLETQKDSLEKDLRALFDSNLIREGNS